MFRGHLELSCVKLASDLSSFVIERSIKYGGVTLQQWTLVLSSPWVLTPISFSWFYVNFRFSSCLLLTFHLDDMLYTGELFFWVYPSRNQLTVTRLVSLRIWHWKDSNHPPPFFQDLISGTETCISWNVAFWRSPLTPLKSLFF